jgi:hypothetical protein
VKSYRIKGSRALATHTTPNFAASDVARTGTGFKHKVNELTYKKHERY